MCPRRLSRRKCHFLIAENIWLREKRSLEKSQFYTWEDDVVHAKSFFSLCRQKMYERPHKTTNKSVQEISEDDKSWKPEMRKRYVAQWTSRLKQEMKLQPRTPATAELKLKRDAKEQRKQDFNYGFICISSAFKLGQATRITSRNPLSPYASVPGSPSSEVLWCCSLEWNTTLMGTWAGLFHLW